MQKFLISNEKIKAQEAFITGQDAKHIAKVLRMRLNDKIIFTNGKGTDFSAIIKEISSEKIKLTIRESHTSDFESPIQITIFQGMLKDKKMDTIVKHLTELGISEWTPLYCERSIPTPNEKKIKSRIQRWKKITMEALKQCNRSMIPKINKPVTFAEMIKETYMFDLKIIFWENATASIKELNQNRKNIKTICILIGPEGGFSMEEAKLTEKEGFQILSLGPRILRAETASITACSLLQHYFGDI